MQADPPQPPHARGPHRRTHPQQRLRRSRGEGRPELGHGQHADLDRRRRQGVRRLEEGERGDEEGLRRPDQELRGHEAGLRDADPQRHDDGALPGADAGSQPHVHQVWRQDGERQAVARRGQQVEPRPQGRGLRGQPDRHPRGGHDPHQQPPRDAVERRGRPDPQVLDRSPARTDDLRALARLPAGSPSPHPGDRRRANGDFKNLQHTLYIFEKTKPSIK